MQRVLLVLAMCVAAAWAIPAQGQQVLHMYSALDTAESQLYIPQFEKDTGIKVQWVRLSSGEVLARLRAEAKNPQVSIWFGGPSQDHIAGKKAGTSAPYKPPLDWTLPPDAHDPEWHWVGYYFGAIGFASNTEFLKRAGVSAPTSWDDLLQPAFKGQIAIAFPYTSGTSYTVLASLVQMMGEDKAFAYWKKLNQNVHHYDKSGSAPVTQAGLGEVGVAVSFSHDILAKGSAKGYPIAMSFPKEGTGFEIGGMSLVKGSGARAGQEIHRLGTDRPGSEHDAAVVPHSTESEGGSGQGGGAGGPGQADQLRRRQGGRGAGPPDQALAVGDRAVMSVRR
jgi:iron(III) transport system substrate-binding protein